MSLQLIDAFWECIRPEYEVVAQVTHALVSSIMFAGMFWELTRGVYALNQLDAELVICVTTIGFAFAELLFINASCTLAIPALVNASISTICVIIFFCNGK